MSPGTMTAGEGPSSSEPLRAGFWTLPKTALGWWAVGLTALVFPVAWMLTNKVIPWAILDTGLAPTMMVLLIDAAAVTGLVGVAKKRERSFLVVLALVVTVPLALLATLFFIGELTFPR